MSFLAGSLLVVGIAIIVLSASACAALWLAGRYQIKEDEDE